jgi:hypothetical protein
MAVNRARIIVIVLLVAALLSPPPPLVACGPFLPVAIFTYSLHPDFPLENYARGSLGILQPTYARSYLYVAYRYLIGTGFDHKEEKVLTAFWQDRLRPSWRPIGEAWINGWLEARAEVPGLDPPVRIDTYRQWRQYYLGYLNCPEDSFRTAVRTLKERISRFGVTSPEVRAWVEAQDQVFANCSGDPLKPEGIIPTAAPANWQSLLRADRAYQIAAANFYAGHFDAAASHFQNITADSASPWRPWASYLFARSLVRKATLGAPEYDEVDAAALAEAEAALQRILTAPDLSEVHPAARRLLNLVRSRLQPLQRLEELAHAVQQKNAASTLYQDLWDYTWLLDRYEGEDRDDLTDWLLTFQQQDATSLEHALKEWKEKASLPWLVASLAKIRPGHPALSPLLEVAERIPAASPGFPTVSFHRLRLLIESGRPEEARQRLDELLAKHPPAFPTSSRNLLLALRTQVARNLEEFLLYAQRVPATITYDEQGLEMPDESDTVGATPGKSSNQAFFDADGAKVFNETLPLALLQQAVRSNVLLPNLRQRLAFATWARAVLLDNHAVGRELAALLAQLFPNSNPLSVSTSPRTTRQRKKPLEFS